MRRIEWLPVAEHNRQSQIAYVGERDPKAAISMGDAIEKAWLSIHTWAGLRAPGNWW